MARPRADVSYNVGMNRLYRNKGDGTFEEKVQTGLIGISTTGSRSRGVGWGDYNNDNLLDLYIGYM